MVAKQQVGVYAPDGSLYITLTDGVGNLATTGGSSGITIDTTTITGGTTGRVLYDNAGTVGEKTVTGTGSAVLATSPTLVTPAFSGSVTGAVGTKTAQSFQFGSTAAGIYARAATLMDISNGTNEYYTFQTSALVMSNITSLGWSSGFPDVVGQDTTISRNAAGIIQFGTTAANASGAWLAAKGTLTGGTLADQAQTFAITATQPASPTGTQNAVTMTVVGSGTASQVNRGVFVLYDNSGGYTGSFTTAAGGFQSGAAGTGSTLLAAAGSNNTIGNFGVHGASIGTTTGLNIGVLGTGGLGITSVGILGSAQNIKNAGTNIGVVGSAINGGTTPVMVGGFFSLNQTTVPAVSAALIADNGSQAQPIFLARDAGTTVFTIADGGAVTVANAVQANTFQAVTNGYYFGAFTSTHMTAPSNGLLLLTNAADNDFSRIQLGGTTSSFPAIKRSSVTLQARLADNSAFTNIQGKLTTDTTYTAGVLVATGYITIYDSTGTAYRVPCLV